MAASSLAAKVAPPLDFDRARDSALACVHGLGFLSVNLRAHWRFVSLGSETIDAFQAEAAGMFDHLATIGARADAAMSEAVLTAIFRAKVAGKDPSRAVVGKVHYTTWHQAAACAVPDAQVIPISDEAVSELVFDQKVLALEPGWPQHLGRFLRGLDGDGRHEYWGRVVAQMHELAKALPQGMHVEIEREWALATARAPAGEPGRADRAAEPLVTLQQAAAMVSRSKKTLERRKGKMPLPQVPGGGGKPDEWAWSELRPWLQKEFDRPLPERFPADRFRPAVP